MPNSVIDVLVIADNSDNIKLYQLIFSGSIYNLVFVDDIEGASNIIDNGDVKVVVVDCMRIRNDIIHFFKDLEGLDSCIQKVVVTDYIDHTQISALISIGRIFNYITKPIDPKRLNVIITKAIEQFTLHKKNAALLQNVQRKNKELKNLLSILRGEEEKFRNIFNSSPDPQFIVDERGLILDSNPNAIVFCCNGDCNCMGRSIFELVADEYVYGLSEYVKRIENNKNERLEVKSRARNNVTEKDYEVTSYSFRYKDNRAYMLSFRNISERKEVQKKVMQTIIETEEKERRRFAQELHDGIGPLLSTTKLYLQWFNMPKTKLDKSVIIAKMEETLEETILSLREVSNNISPNTLLSFGLKAALKNFIGRINNVSGIAFEYECKITERLEQQNEITVYRLICELINNSLKHSQAQSIKILIDGRDRLEVNYEDDGKGFDVDAVMQENKGSGLVNIINRVESLGGKYKIKSAKGKGTQVQVHLNK